MLGAVGPTLAEVGCDILNSRHRIWRNSEGPVYVAVAGGTPATTTTTTTATSTTTTATTTTAATATATTNPKTTKDFRAPAATSTFADGTGAFSTTSVVTATTITVAQALVAAVDGLTQEMEARGCTNSMAAQANATDTDNNNDNDNGNGNGNGNGNDNAAAAAAAAATTGGDVEGPQASSGAGACAVLQVRAAQWLASGGQGDSMLLRRTYAPRSVCVMKLN